ncbi:HalOD1 output domain-containing protein [Halorussus halophilus]|uniref:HalOD1 output domain-containing protein n=1 Tax=Halorussus halophilus TaxID=2650975 RepID=UPI0013011DB8|nr:HalOD1 output domain-containing protein [Halorussus halophilus]
MPENSSNPAIRVGDCRSDQRASTRVALALADVRDEDVTSIRLHDHIDPDALDLLFAPRHDGSERDNGRVSFDVDGYHVTIRSSGLYTIEPPR